MSWESIVVKRGSIREQIEEWKKTVLEGLGSPPDKSQRETLSQQSKTIRQLERELLRKEKALAEAATLLMLKKKVDALLEEKEVGRSMGSPVRK